MILVAIVVASPAFAVEGTIIGKGADGEPYIDIWRTQEAAEDASVLAQVGKKVSAVAPLDEFRACTIATPQRAVTADPNADYVRVIVVDGEQDGCRGLVRRDQFEPKN
ncbi:MAG: hypothetical protein INR68_17405 [Methylobacterium mesophilicum]|nr:hypothetical protein [Methylobacterium mesophilicum]